jgi:predicted permease
MFNKLRLRLRAIFFRSGLEDELESELRFHLEKEIEENIARGMTPEEARQAALRSFGGVEKVKEESRDQRGVGFMEDVWQDLRYGLRMMLKNPGFTAVAVLTLALGIGANTAIFSMVNALLLRPLPYSEADRLVVIATTIRREQVEVRSTSYPDFISWRDQNTVFEQIAARTSNSFSLLGVNEPERINGELVSANYFTLLGAQVVAGRTFLTEEDRTPDAHRVVIIGHGLWQRRFEGRLNLVGQTIQLSDGNYTVVGIMPEGFRGVSDQAELWLPMMMTSAVRAADYLQQRDQRWLSSIARLKPGVNLQQAQTEMDTIARRLEQTYPSTNTNRGALLTPLREQLFGDMQLMLWILLGAVGCVLLVACVNVANLLLQRAAMRRKEMVIRLALGATPGRLASQLLTESLLLAFIGGLLGVMIAFWSADFLIALSPISFPSFIKLTLDARVLGFSLLVSGFTGLLFGLAPAIQAAKPMLNEALKDGGRGSSGGLGRSRLLGSLIVAEISLAVILLVGAGLMIRSLQQLQTVNPGFNTERLLTMRFTLPPQKYPREQIGVFNQQLTERLRTLPGAQAAALSSDLPLSGDTSAGPIELEGKTVTPADDEIRIYRHRVTPQFFSTLNIPLTKGRDFTIDDHALAPGAVIISEALAQRLWPDADPLGKRLREAGSENPWLSVVGVAADVKYRGLPQNPNTDPDVYFPLLQRPTNNLSLAIRTEGNPTSLTAAVRSELQKLDHNLPVYGVTTMAQQAARQTTQSRFSAWLLGLFGALALTLAAIGIYSVMAYAVEQRTHEIGIRLALGAHVGDVLTLVIKQGMRLALIGVALGLCGALALTQLMKGLLFRVASADPLTYAGIALLLLAVALLACWIPARRATKVDPIVALRQS